MSIGKDDFHLDLLFFHRNLRRLIAVELTLESFQPAHVGQMELYLRWLDKYERAPGEEAPIGLILCASADAEQVELLQLDKKSIRVSEYLTELPPIKLLQARLMGKVFNWEKIGGGAWESNPPSLPSGKPQLDLKSRPATRPDSPPHCP
jgi:hypothetical protein